MFRNYFLKNRKANEKIKLFCITLSSNDYPNLKIILAPKNRNTF